MPCWCTEGSSGEAAVQYSMHTQKHLHSNPGHSSRVAYSTSEFHIRDKTHIKLNESQGNELRRKFIMIFLLWIKKTKRFLMSRCNFTEVRVVALRDLACLASINPVKRPLNPLPHLRSEAAPRIYDIICIHVSASPGRCLALISIELRVTLITTHLRVFRSGCTGVCHEGRQTGVSYFVGSYCVTCFVKNIDD